MNKIKLKKVIVEIVESSQGLKATELAVRFAVYVHEHNMNVEGDGLLDLLDEMDTNGELVFVDYVLPQMDYRLKQFILPKGTKVTVKE